jgi:hypothetical protein
VSMDNTLLVEVVIAHGKPTPAHLLHEGTPFIMGGYVFHVVDVEFSDDHRDVMITMVRYDVEGKSFTQKMTVAKEFEINTLWVTQPRNAEVYKVEEHVDARSNS